MNLNKRHEYQSEHFKNIEYVGAQVNACEFLECLFEKCNFSEVIFERCKFVDCEFIQCNLSNAQLRFSKFSEVCFRDSKIIGVDWTQVAWPRFVFSAPIKFFQSILSDCSFYGLNLQELVLQECKAHNVDFRDGDFNQANFTYTDLTGSLFLNTNLSAADFSEAINYDIDVLRNIIKKAKFSRFEAMRLLDRLDIEIKD
ncbi:MAG TPA: pentapeptide repeat-containing protein [Cellvibrionaceae bacterium]